MNVIGFLIHNVRMNISGKTSRLGWARLVSFNVDRDKTEVVYRHLFIDWLILENACRAVMDN